MLSLVVDVPFNEELLVQDFTRRPAQFQTGATDARCNLGAALANDGQFVVAGPFPKAAVVIASIYTGGA